jgi:hypothetical protein
MQYKESGRIFWKKIENIKFILTLNDTAIANMLALTEPKYKKFKNNELLPALPNLDRLCIRLGLNMNHFSLGKIDYMSLRERFYGNSYALPTKYDYGKLSKSRTIINCLDYLELKYNEDVKYAVLSHLQIDPLFFKEDNRSMNINVISDLCALLKKTFHFNKDDFTALGRWSYEVNKNKELGQILSSFQNKYEMFEAICNGLSKEFEKNFDYTLKSNSNNRIIVHSTPSEEAKDLLRKKLIGNTTTCLTKVGVFSSFTRYQSLPTANVVKTKCIYQGDQVTEYQINT